MGVTWCSYCYSEKEGELFFELSVKSRGSKDIIDKGFSPISNPEPEAESPLKMAAEDKIDMVAVLGEKLKFNPNYEKFVYGERREDQAYTGQLNKDNEMEGYGILGTSTTLYKGEFKHSVYSGRGILKTFDSTKQEYEGNFKKGQYHNYGILRCGNYKYQGNWDRDTKDGEGEETFEDGTYYKGTYKKDKRSGYGILKQPKQGLEYEGEFKNNEFDGKGTLKTSEGTYQGEFLCGKKHGNGILKTLKNQTIKGTWVNDYLHGQASVTSKKGKNKQVDYIKGLKKSHKY